MSDEEMEDFDINDEDLRRAFNPGQSRRNKMSKEEAMLGIWASRSYSSDEEDEFSYKNQSKKFSKNVDFVSSSSADKKTENKTTNKENDEELSEEEPIIEDSESDDNMAELSSKDTFILNQYKTKLKNEIKAEKSFQSKPKQKQTASHTEAKDVGNWERHTKGIGMKLLQKMGWEKGKGIGKELQGRAIPVEATVRKGKGAIGAHGPESKESKHRQYKDDEEEEEVEIKKPHISQWKKDKKNKKPQYSLRTPEELIELANKHPNKLKKAEQMLEISSQLEAKSDLVNNKIKIIDMTGKEQRVMHGYESISQITKLSKYSSELESEKKQRAFDLPELTHNLDLLLNMTEDKILHYDKKLKHYEDMVVSLAYEEKKTKEKLASESSQIEKIKNLLNILEKCEMKVNQENVTLEELIKIFKDLQTNYTDEFIIFNLSQVSIPLLTPLLKRKMKLWSPFENEEEVLEDRQDSNDVHSLAYCSEMYSDLKILLAENNFGNSEMNLYHRLVWETWMPSMRRIMSEISIKQYSIECVDLINKWKPLLSNWIIQNILEQIVLPKLISEVDEWNPLTDTIPIHVWILPWLNLMKDRLDSTLFPTIRFKLANALTSWHPSDLSAKAILQPWKPPVFSVSAWEQFLFKNILPKLELILEQEFILNPSQQNLEPWNWIMSWFELIPLANFVNLIEKSFFPKWLKVLSTWLNSEPNYEEVSKWYMGWKSLLGDKLAQHPNIKTKLSQGLMMMNRSLSGAQVSYNQEETGQVKPVNIESEDLKQKGIGLTTVPSVSSFKDIIERKASEHNLLFLPVINKFKEGKQVYRLGNLNIYIDRNVVFMLQNGNWIPASINEIVQKAL